MQEAKRDKRIIGDFVWAAQDYLGEVGIGAWGYKVMHLVLMAAVAG